MRYFYECGGCDAYHPLGWTGDCRDDEQRYNWENGALVNRFGRGFDEFDASGKLAVVIVEEDYKGYSLCTCGREAAFRTLAGQDLCRECAE